MGCSAAHSSVHQPGPLLCTEGSCGRGQGPHGLSCLPPRFQGLQTSSRRSSLPLFEGALRGCETGVPPGPWFSAAHAPCWEQQLPRAGRDGRLRGQGFLRGTRGTPYPSQYFSSTDRPQPLVNRGHSSSLGTGGRRGWLHGCAPAQLGHGACWCHGVSPERVIGSVSERAGGDEGEPEGTREPGFLISLEIIIYLERFF